MIRDLGTSLFLIICWLFICNYLQIICCHRQKMLKHRPLSWPSPTPPPPRSPPHADFPSSLPSTEITSRASWRGQCQRAAREDVCKARYVLKKSPSLLHPLFLLKFVQDCCKARWLCQGVYSASNLPEAPRVAGLSIAQIALQAIYCAKHPFPGWPSLTGLLGITRIGSTSTSVPVLCSAATRLRGNPSGGSWWTRRSYTVVNIAFTRVTIYCLYVAAEWKNRVNQDHWTLPIGQDLKVEFQAAPLATRRPP